MFIVVIVILIWLTLIIIGNATKEKEVEVVPEKPKVKEESEPEVFLENISDDLLEKILPGTFQNNDKYVSISSNPYGCWFEEKDLKYFLRSVLRPLRQYPRYSWYQNQLYPNRRINDDSIKLIITYFDKSFDFKTVNITLKIQNIGYVCASPTDNIELANLKRFLGRSPVKMSEDNSLVFSEKLQEIERKEQDERVKEFVEQVFDRHISYNEEAERYSTEKAVSITSPEIFFNFCDLVSYRVPSDLRSELTNYLYILCEN
jgi:hypothetical protein